MESAICIQEVDPGMPTRLFKGPCEPCRVDKDRSAAVVRGPGTRRYDIHAVFAAKTSPGMIALDGNAVVDTGLLIDPKMTVPQEFR